MATGLSSGFRRWSSLMTFAALAMMTGAPASAFEQPTKPRISEVRATFQDPAYHGGACTPTVDDTITIWGENLTGRNFKGQELPPVVTFGDYGELDLCKHGTKEIVALCPEGACDDGDYRIKVNTKDRWIHHSVEYDLTIPATGPVCAANEVLLGAGGGCISIVNLVAMGTPRTFFVTSETFKGNLVSEAKEVFPNRCATVTLGLEAGDCICQATADGAPLVPAGTYKAWLSDQTGSPSSRFTKSLGPYNKVDGLPIASSYANLVGGADLLSKPNVDEAGAVVPHNAVWTGTQPDGSSAGADCSSWTGALSGAFGVPDNLDLRWTDDPDISPTLCEIPNLQAGIYCFEQ